MSMLIDARDLRLAGKALAALLEAIEDGDPSATDTMSTTDPEILTGAYDRRNNLILRALAAAANAGLPAGFRSDPEEPGWIVAYVELPTGQVSWHLPEHATPWDGHDTDEKYRRCRAFRERHPR